jgi:RimJ/RimL family protein N-acetyltransferase
VRTKRHLLSPVGPDDAEAFHLIWGDPGVIWWGHSRSLAETRRLLERFGERCSGGPPLGWRLIVLEETGEILGDVALESSPVLEGAVEIGWHLRREHWGAGHATEAAGRMLEHAFAHGVDEVFATIVEDNARSIALAERIGMRRTPEDVERIGLLHGVWRVDRASFSRRDRPAGR